MCLDNRETAHLFLVAYHMANIIDNILEIASLEMPLEQPARETQLLKTRPSVTADKNKKKRDPNKDEKYETWNLESIDDSSFSPFSPLALPFFCSLHCRSLCRTIPNENEADFPYSDKKYGVCSCMCFYIFLVFFFHHPDLFHLGRV